MVVHPKAPFVAWAKAQDEEYELDEFSEPNIYLVEEDFFEDEPILKANFKKIFKNELFAVSDDEDAFPPINFENFEHFFTIILGNTVFDLEKGKIEGEKI